MSDTAQRYLKKFRNLNVDRAHGPAPHKPVLLLAVIELIEQGKIPDNRILFSPDLVATFRKHWVKVTARTPNAVMPFFHLRSDKFWHLHANAGAEAALKTATQIRAASIIREIVSHATLDNDLFALLLDPQHREALRQAIIDEYFPNRRAEIESVIDEGRKIHQYETQLLHKVETKFRIKEAVAVVEPEVEPVRNAGFRRAVMTLYAYTCCICRLHIVTMDGESAVDAAHIVPWSVSHNDDPRNGIALCKLHHWSFDIGLVSVDQQYQVVVSPLLDGNRPTEWVLTQLRSQPILLPNQTEFHPSLEAFDWHRKCKLQK